MLQLNVVIHYQHAYPDYQTIEVNQVQVGVWNHIDGLTLEESFSQFLNNKQVQYIKTLCEETCEQAA